MIFYFYLTIINFKKSTIVCNLVGSDRRIGVGTIRGVVVGAEDIIGPEIEAFRSRVDPIRRHRSQH